MNQNYFIGVDISKSKIDCAIINAQMNLFSEKEVQNTDQRVKSFLSSVLKSLKVKACEVLICCENTGIYNRPLERVCQSLGIDLWVEHPLKIKRASTDMRGKDDRRDAIRIAEYAARYHDKKVLYKEPSDVIKELNCQVKIRETLLGQKVAIENQIREASTHDITLYKTLKIGYKAVLKTLDSSIETVERKIEELTQKEESLAENSALLKSIPGIGTQSAINLIIVTNNFTSFTSAKHLACYAGVVPFQNRSGTLVKKDRISKMANLRIKKLLHLAAMSACRADQELKSYYIRKVKEGKNKMSVLNAIRNKLVHRIMAVITRKTPFVKSQEGFYQNRNTNACILT
jgi:transposase